MNLLFADKVRANNNIWLLGDNFLNEAIPVLKQIQFEKKGYLYMYQNFDVKGFFPKKLDQTVFGKQLLNQLTVALTEDDRLPTVIILVVGNRQVDNMVLTPVQTKRIWNIVFMEITRLIRSRKDQLDPKCYFHNQPRLYINNMFPRHKDDCDDKGRTTECFKTKRRRFNNVLPQAAAKHDVTVLPITGILPDEKNFFLGHAGELSGKGHEAFWTSLSREFKFNEELCKEREKSRLVQEVIDKRSDQNRNDTQKRKFEKERSRLIRGGPKGNRHQETFFSKGKKPARSHSAIR